MMTAIAIDGRNVQCDDVGRRGGILPPKHTHNFTDTVAVTATAADDTKENNDITTITATSDGQVMCRRSEVTKWPVQLWQWCWR